MSRWIVLFAVLFFVCAMFSFVSAQLDSVGNQLEGTAGNLEKNISAIREFTEKDKLDFIGAQWKEVLLKNKAVASIDALFTRMDVVFLVLFKHSWALSLEMLFVLLSWFATLLILYKYGSFIKNWLLRLIVVFVINVGIAQIGIYTVVSGVLVRLVLYKTGFWWNLAMFVVALVILLLYFVFL